MTANVKFCIRIPQAARLFIVSFKYFKEFVHMVEVNPEANLQRNESSSIPLSQTFHHEKTPARSDLSCEMKAQQGRTGA